MNDRNSNPDTNSLTFSNLVIGHRLGRGSTCHVFKSHSIRPKKSYAMKVIDKCAPEYCPSLLSQQIKIHKLLSHKNICQFYKHFEDEFNHYMVTEYCPDGEIAKFLSEPLSEEMLIEIAWQVGEALNYMHNQVGCVHGDLKLSNILISGSQLKLCDFGFASFLEEENQAKQSGAFGTLMYMAPEILLKNQNIFLKEADIWAFGICLLTLMNKNSPFTAENQKQLKKQILQGKHIGISKKNFPNFSNKILQLIKKMLQKDYVKRINIQNFLRDSLFEKFNQEYQNQLNQIGKFEQDLSKQQINKSIFNQTLDTDSDPLQNSILSENYKMWAFCLKPQTLSTGEDGSITIENDYSILVKIKKTVFRISKWGNCLQILSGTTKNNKVFCYEEIIQNQKVNNLFSYALQLITMIKKKQCLKEEIINGRYFWATKKTIGCVSNEIMMQRDNGQKQIIFSNLSQPQVKHKLERTPQNSRLISIFQKGESSLLQKMDK